MAGDIALLQLGEREKESHNNDDGVTEREEEGGGNDEVAPYSLRNELSFLCTKGIPLGLSAVFEWGLQTHVHTNTYM
jgi:hypothetical protein